MLDFIKKKKQEDEESEPELDESEEGEAETDDSKEKPQDSDKDKSSMRTAQISSDIEKIKASIEAFQEVRKSFTERFDRVSEEIGELRSMILDRDKIVHEIELHSVKASNLVESVQPEKLMSEIRRGEAKIEALRANIEGNETISERIMEEIKDIKKKIEFFGGIDEIISLSEDIKKELVEIKKVESFIKINSDKVQTIYAEMRARFQEMDIFRDDFEEIKANMEQNTKDVDFLKNKVLGLAEKDDLDRLMNKVQRYIEVLKDLEKKSSLTKDIDQLKELLDNIK